MIRAIQETQVPAHAYDRVVRQRNELLAALEDVISQIYAEGPIDLRKAETAIENAKK